jgi:hypothetical protein
MAIAESAGGGLKKTDEKKELGLSNPWEDAE